MILARLALRNLLRQRRRTALTLLVVVAGFLALSLAAVSYTHLTLPTKRIV